MSLKSSLQSIFRKINGVLFSFTHYNKFLGSYFLRNVKTYKVNDCHFNLSDNLFPVGYYTRFLFGNYEKSEIKLISKYLKPTDQVIELGACIGVTSCVTNKILQDPTKHVVVEANPRLISEIEKNRKDNNCAFKIENKLISSNKINKFYTYNIAISGSLEEKKHNPKLKLDKVVDIEGTSFQDLEKVHDIHFNTLVMDIEGAEYILIPENKEYLSKLRLLIIEFHPHLLKNGKQSDYVNLLKEMGFDFVDRKEISEVFINRNYS